MSCLYSATRVRIRQKTSPKILKHIRLSATSSFFLECRVFKADACCGIRGTNTGLVKFGILSSHNGSSYHETRQHSSRYFLRHLACIELDLCRPWDLS